MKHLLIILIILSSCKPSEVITEREYYDTTIIKEVVKVVEIPGETVQSETVNIDSLLTLIKNGVKPEIINRTLIKENPETQTQLKLIFDHMGNLTALCETQDKQIQYLESEIQRLRLEKNSTVEIKDLTFWKQVRLVVIGLLVGVILSVLLRMFRVI